MWQEVEQPAESDAAADPREMEWYKEATQHHGGGREGFEALRARHGHKDGPRYGNRGGKNKDWYTARARAQRAGPQVLQAWLLNNPKPSSSSSTPQQLEADESAGGGKGGDRGSKRKWEGGKGGAKGSKKK